MKLVQLGVEHYWAGAVGDFDQSVKRIDEYIREFGPPHLIFTSPPCQDFSGANVNAQGTTRDNGQLFSKSVELIKYLQTVQVDKRGKDNALVFIENEVPKNAIKKELDEIVEINSFKSDAREAWPVCYRERLIWSNTFPGVFNKNPTGAFNNIIDPEPDQTLSGTPNQEAQKVTINTS